MVRGDGINHDYMKSTKKNRSIIASLLPALRVLRGESRSAQYRSLHLGRTANHEPSCFALTGDVSDR